MRGREERYYRNGSLHKKVMGVGCIFTMRLNIAEYISIMGPRDISLYLGQSVNPRSLLIAS